jgi:survival of motor neuron-related-splicing factor 30
LSQVELALVSEPNNADLTSLRNELKELIALTEQSIAQGERKPSTSKVSTGKGVASNVPAFQSGDEILAKYSGDNAWYPARIASVGGSEDHLVYSVVFKGYNSTEVVQPSAVKPIPPGYNHNTAGPSGGGKRKAEEEAEKERKKKKNEKKAEVRAIKAKEQSSKQASWLKFAKKSEKKGTPIAGLAGTSIFKTPENPHGRGMLCFASSFLSGTHSLAFQSV